MSALPRLPLDRECPMHPPKTYARLQANEPVARAEVYNGDKVWLITKYEYVKALLGDERFSAVPSMPGYPQLSAGVGAAALEERTFLRMDNPDHDHYRKMLTREFTVKAVQRLSPRVQQMIDGLIDDMLTKGPPLDLVPALGLALPSMVITLLLGAPEEDHAFVQDRASARINFNATPEQTRAATRDLLGYLEKLVTEKENEPGDDILSRLIVTYGRTGALSHEEIVHMGRLLISAGHETTSSMISLGTLALLENPGQQAALVGDPSLADRAVEELLRYLTIIPFSTRRVATAEVEIGGHTIRPGEGVFMLTPAANRDPEHFPEPDRLDITRDARHHLAFGYGVHQCLGQQLARMELQAVFATLFTRIPTLRLAVPMAEVSFRDDSVTYGVRALPVTW
ncbi:cytochrome P450 [Acrocarpospora macrocephala]|uniref:Cytochrome P450 n=1 Tax=Acrocarpospora macrocephala TaxID=150177 RepID=A0A5M3WK75_9ACTN|nr:cytochrome P450 [Acrocarpospora macrocephala]GES09587.1 cytochrome P450 [Acrocarpospora macrocephala]